MLFKFKLSQCIFNIHVIISLKCFVIVLSCSVNILGFNDFGDILPSLFILTREFTNKVYAVYAFSISFDAIHSKCINTFLLTLSYSNTHPKTLTSIDVCLLFMLKQNETIVVDAFLFTLRFFHFVYKVTMLDYTLTKIVTVFPFHRICGY